MSNPKSSSGNSGNSSYNGNSGNSGNSYNGNSHHSSTTNGNCGNPDDFGPRKRITERRRQLDGFDSGDCICSRPSALVVCNACGFFETGRIRYPCPVHHQVCYP